MTTFRQIARVIPSREQQDGADVKLRRSIVTIWGMKPY